jgi:micrococcal nuclease
MIKRVNQILKIRLITILLFAFLLFLHSTPPNAQQFEIATVLGVIDGDTLKVELQGREETIRLIGIDAPESRMNPKTKKDSERSGEDIKTITAMGKKATAFAKTLIRKGDSVKLEFDVKKKNGKRLLAYVFLSGERMLNEEMVRAGYASPMTIAPNVKYQDRFSKSYYEARENNAGLWQK